MIRIARKYINERRVNLLAVHIGLKAGLTASEISERCGISLSAVYSNGRRYLSDVIIEQAYEEFIRCESYVIKDVSVGDNKMFILLNRGDYIMYSENKDALFAYML